MRIIVAGALFALALAASAWGVTHAAGPAPVAGTAIAAAPAAAPADPSAPAAGAPEARAPQSGRRARPRRVPARIAGPHIEIAAIGVRAPLVDIGVNGSGRLQAPATYDEVGWWTEGAAPGEDGPAVFAAHVDSASGPAVFNDLEALGAGDQIVVRTEDGTQRFAVTGVERHPKAAFPTERVYAPTSGPTIRLITCGGAWDAGRGHYRDNVIVFGKAVS